MKKCTGIFGYLFGHKYKTIYSTSRNKPNNEEITKLVSNLSKDAAPMLRDPNTGGLSPFGVSDRRNDINTYNNRVERIIHNASIGNTIPQYEICTRCGDKLKIN